MPLVVRPSPIHSVGVYTSKPIRKGTRVVEYAGERITAEEADRRYDGVSRTYLYGLDDGKTVIDGEGLGAYLNHSCDPNCEVDEIKGRVWLFAIRDIWSSATKIFTRLRASSISKPLSLAGERALVTNVLTSDDHGMTSTFSLFSSRTMFF